MATYTEMVSLTKGYRPYKLREARFWQKVFLFIHLMNIPFGLQAPCWALDGKTKVVLVPTELRVTRKRDH